MLGTGSGIVGVGMIMMAAYGGSYAAVRYLIAQHGVGLDRVLVQCFMARMVASMCGQYDGVQTLFFLARAATCRGSDRCATITSVDVVVLLLPTCAASSS